MKITFLGTGAASAYPLPFCQCAYCRTAREQKGKNLRRRSSVLINSDLLIDLGPDVFPSACAYGIDLTKVRFLLQTHAHSDHFDPGHLITRIPEYAGQGISRLNLAASRETLRKMGRRLCGEEPGVDLFDPKWKEKLNLAVFPVSAGESIQLGTYHVTALDACHDESEQALIYAVRQGGRELLYATDLCRLEAASWEILIGFSFDYVILDQTYGPGTTGGGHLNADQVVEIIAEMRSQGILKPNGESYATHLSHEGNPPHNELARFAASRGYQIAYDGLVLETAE